MKRILALLTCLSLLVLVGCSGSSSYTRDTNPGEIVEITYAQYKEMLKKGDPFLVIVSQTNCGYCIKYKETVLNDYVKEHGVTIYDLDITKEQDPKAIFDEFKAEYEKVSSDGFGTPVTIVAKKGKIDHIQVGVLSTEEFDKLVQKYELDQKKDK